MRLCAWPRPGYVHPISREPCNSCPCPPRAMWISQMPVTGERGQTLATAYLGDRSMETYPRDFRRSAVAILRRNPSAGNCSSTSPGHSCKARCPRGNSRLCPAGTPENSPPFQRWESDPDQPEKSRQGRQTPTKAVIARGFSRSLRSHRVSFCRPCRGFCRERIAAGLFLGVLSGTKSGERWPLDLGRRVISVCFTHEKPWVEDREPT